MSFSVIRPNESPQNRNIQFSKCSVLFVASSIMLASCGTKLEPSETHISGTGSAVQSAVTNPPPGYGSDPVDINPETGIHVTAEKNALYSDTRITVNSVEENELVYASALNLYDEGEYVLRAWDFDAGLNDDEALPGEYHVEIDLAELNIPESLYECMTAYRLNNYNELSEYSCTLKGSVLSYSTEKNSVSLLVAVPAVIIGVPTVMAVVNAANEKYEKEAYYSFKKPNHKKRVNEHGSYVVYWLTKDVDRHQEEKKKRLDEIRAETQVRAEREFEEDEKTLQYTKGSLYWLFNRNESVADRVKRMLDEDEEYQRLNSEIEIPKNVQIILDEIDTAWNYLGSHEYVRMPSGTTEYQIRSGDGKNFGEAVSGFSVKSYIVLNMEDPDLFESDTAKGQTMRDNMLLTITHETFHLSQERYHTGFFTDSNRFDEMVTLVMEADAKDYYKVYGYIETDPKLTDADYWISLTQPIDSEKFFSQLFMQEEGYTLSQFVQYLRKETGKEVPVTKIMNCRSKVMYPGTSEPLKLAFGLTDKQFDAYFRKWCLANRKKFLECYRVMHAYEQYNPYPYQEKTLDRDAPAYSEFEKSTYSAGVRVFKQKDSEPMALLLVPDSVPKGESPACNILPCDDYSLTANGAFVPAQRIVQNDMQKERLFLEIYGNPKLGSVPKGYTVWPLSARKAPSVRQDKDGLFIRITDSSSAMKKGLLDGVTVTARSSLGEEFEFTIAQKDLGKEFRLDLSALNLNKDSECTVDVWFSEYTTSAKGKILSGPDSGSASIQLTGSADSLTFKNLTLYRDTLTGLTDQALKEDFIIADPLPEAVSVTITGNRAVITLDGYTWGFRMEDGDSRMTSRSSRKTIRLEAEVYKDDLSDQLYEGTITSLPDMEGTTYMEGGSPDDYGSGTMTISLVSAAKPGTFRLLFNDQGKVTEGSIVLYGDFKKEAVMSDGDYSSSLQQVYFIFHNE